MFITTLNIGDFFYPLAFPFQTYGETKALERLESMSKISVWHLISGKSGIQTQMLPTYMGLHPVKPSYAENTKSKIPLIQPIYQTS